MLMILLIRMHHYTLTRQFNNGIQGRGVLTDRERFDPARNKRRRTHIYAFKYVEVCQPNLGKLRSYQVSYRIGTKP